MSEACPSLSTVKAWVDDVVSGRLGQSDVLLVALERRPEVWEIAMGLLHESSTTHRFFGAKMIYGKLQRQFLQAEGMGLVDALVSALLNRLQALASERPIDMVSCRYMSLSLSVIALQVGQPQAISQLLSSLSSLVSTSPDLVLEFLTLLPEECENEHVDVSAGAKARFCAQLNSSLPEVLAFLVNMWSIENRSVKTRVLKAVQNWLFFSGCKVSDVLSHPLVQLSLANLANNDDLFAPSISIWTDYIARWRGDDALASLLLPRLPSLFMLWEQLSSKGSNIDEQESDNLRHIATFLNDFSEAYLEQIIEDPNRFKQFDLVSLLLQTTRVRDCRISVIALNFFESLSHLIEQYRIGSTHDYHNRQQQQQYYQQQQQQQQQYQRLQQHFSPVFRDLLHISLTQIENIGNLKSKNKGKNHNNNTDNHSNNSNQHSQHDDDDDNHNNNHSSFEDSMETRETWRHTISDCALVLGDPLCRGLLGDVIRNEMGTSSTIIGNNNSNNNNNNSNNNNVNSSGPSLSRLEAVLYAFQGVVPGCREGDLTTSSSTNTNTDTNTSNSTSPSKSLTSSSTSSSLGTESSDDEAIRLVLSAAFAMPLDRSPPVVPHTVLKTIAALAPWINQHFVDHQNQVVGLVVSQLGRKDSSQVAAETLAGLLLNRGDRYVGLAEGLVSQYESMRPVLNSVSLDTELKVLEAVSHVVGKLTPRDVLQVGLRSLVNPIGQRLVSQQMALSTGRMDPDQVRCEFRRLRVVVSHAADGPGAEEVLGLFLSYASQLYPLQSSTSTSSDLLRESIVAFLKQSITKCRSRQGLRAISQFIVDGLRSSSLTRSLVYLASELMDVFGGSDADQDPEVANQVTTMLVVASEAFFREFSSIESLSRQPYLVEEFFYFVCSACSKRPDFVSQWDGLSPVVRAAIAGLGCESQPVQKSAMFIMENLIVLCKRSQTLSRDFSVLGQDITTACLRLVAGQVKLFALDESGGSLADVLINLKSVFQGQFQTWVVNGVNQLDEVSQNVANRLNFVKRLVGSMSDPELIQVIQDYTRDIARAK